MPSLPPRDDSQVYALTIPTPNVCGINGIRIHNFPIIKQALFNCATREPSLIFLTLHKANLQDQETDKVKAGLLIVTL